MIYDNISKYVRENDFIKESRKYVRENDFIKESSKYVRENDFIKESRKYGVSLAIKTEPLILQKVPTNLCAILSMVHPVALVSVQLLASTQES